MDTIYKRNLPFSASVLRAFSRCVQPDVVVLEYVAMLAYSLYL
jgi:hypothetical protein